MKRIKLARTLFSFAIMLLVAGMIVDFLRKPTVPDSGIGTVYYDLQHNPVLLGQFAPEQPVVLYFWGSWCGFCRYISPAIDELAQKGTPVITVALRSGDDHEVRHYLNEHQYGFTVINDQRGEIAEQWKVSVTPTIVMLKQGKIELATTGFTSVWGLKVRLFLAQFF